jgi:hypothetical protein
MPHEIRSLLPILLLAALPAAMPTAASAQVLISVNIAPPVLPVYEQPEAPAPGYLWTPGYWAWNADEGDYYWVPGAWVTPPSPGLLWTPGYWGWEDGAYLWHEGYWGPHVGFYGGVNYGFGYGGVGFVGGEWRGGTFFYNTAVVHVRFGGPVFVRPVPAPVVVARVSFNGGRGGIVARPTEFELSAARDHHIAFTEVQRAHVTESFHHQEFRAAKFAGEHPGGGAFRGEEHRPPEALRGGGAFRPEEHRPPEAQRGGPFRPEEHRPPEAQRGGPFRPEEHRPPEAQKGGGGGNPARREEKEEKKEDHRPR